MIKTVRTALGLDQRRPKIDSLNFRQFSEENRIAARDAWRELALSGEKNLENAYLAGADLLRADLSNADLRFANFEGANLTFAQLYYANLKNSNLRFANLQFTNLGGANLNYAWISEANLQGATLSGAVLQSANAYAANLNGANLSEANLHETNLENANLFLANLTGVRNLTSKQLESARNVFQIQNSDFSEIPQDFSDSKLVHRLILASILPLPRDYKVFPKKSSKASDNPERPQINSQNFKQFSLAEREAAAYAWKELALSGEKDLEYAYLEYLDLQGADLQDANLRGASLRAADLQNANLQFANLQSVNFFEAYLHRVNLQGADLRDAFFMIANLLDANLTGTNLQGANLQYATLKGTNLFLVDLKDVKNLTGEQIRSARNVFQIQPSEFSEIPTDFRSYEPVTRLLKAQALRK